MTGQGNASMDSNFNDVSIIRTDMSTSFSSVSNCSEGILNRSLIAQSFCISAESDAANLVERDAQYWAYKILRKYRRIKMARYHLKRYRRCIRKHTIR